MRPPAVFFLENVSEQIIMRIYVKICVSDVSTEKTYKPLCYAGVRPPAVLFQGTKGLSENNNAYLFEKLYMYVFLLRKPLLLSIVRPPAVFLQDNTRLLKIIMRI